MGIISSNTVTEISQDKHMFIVVVCVIGNYIHFVIAINSLHKLIITVGYFQVNIVSNFLYFKSTSYGLCCAGFWELYIFKW